ncbi:AEX-3 domain-containing protein [Trametes polyzona]|nr:AEX-3 domain-containing protein [Trametes polyzona]
MHSPRTRTNPPVPQPLAVSATPGPAIGEKILKSRFSEDEGNKNHGAPSASILSRRATQKSNMSLRSTTSAYSKDVHGGAAGGTSTSTAGAATLGVNPAHATRPGSSGRRHGVPRPITAPDPIITISSSSSAGGVGAGAGAGANSNGQPARDDAQSGLALGQGRNQGSLASPSFSFSHNPSTSSFHSAQDDDLDYVTVDHPASGPVEHAVVPSRSADKAARVLGFRQRQSMEPIPGSNRNSLASARSAPPSVSAPPPTPTGPTLPLASLYVVSGLPKSPHTWTLADPDSVMGLHHSEGAVGRWWRPEVLGSTISPGAGGGKRKKKSKTDDASAGLFSSSGHLSKQEVGKMLSKALKLSFTREVEIIASTLQPASTVHTFTFNLPAPATPLAPSPSTDVLRASVLTTNTDVSSYAYPYADDPFTRHARPSSAYLGPTSSNFLSPNGHTAGARLPSELGGGIGNSATGNGQITYHGVCLTVWSHADAERTAAIRRTLEAGRARKESAQSLVASRMRRHASDATNPDDPAVRARRRAKMSSRGPWGAGTDAETDLDPETDGEGGAVSESDYEVASTVGHTPGESTLFLPGDTVFWLPYALTLVSRFPIYDLMRDYLTLSWARFSKDVQSHTLQISKILSHPAPRPGELGGAETSLEVVARFPGGLDFGRGLVDVNFTMWPLFKCLNIDNILTICEIALAPTGRVLFFSRHPAMLGIAVMTVKYLVELRGWNGVALSAVHSRDAKIYIEDPGPWIIGLATEARYAVRPPPEVCIVDLDINYLNCAAPPPGVVSVKQQRDRYRQKLLAAFEPHYHPDHCVPRFRPVCKIQAKRGAASTAVADMVKPPEWWHSTRIIQAFDSVLADKMKKPSLLKRISSFGSVRPPPRLSPAEQHIQLSIRKRASAFVDARDDLETKIGRLSRRLNFLMTESDLWRDKFVTFEQYAEKLSVEASELRSKINKEQKETKRLSSMITMTAAEKSKLQQQLQETEQAHLSALRELEEMRATMEKMEEERAEMIAEVEAQIERALAHMAVDVDDSDYGGSRPSSRMSSRSAPTTTAYHRRGSDARSRPLRSFSTESTLAESYSGDLREEFTVQPERATGTVLEEPEEEEAGDDVEREKQKEKDRLKKKRFSAADMDAQQDGMKAVDEGISQKSDKIAQKVLQIQRKLESALASDAYRRSLDSESELSESGRARSRRSKPKARKLTDSPALSGLDTPIHRVDSKTSDSKDPALSASESETKTEIAPEDKPRPQVVTTSTLELPGLRKIPSSASVGAFSPSTVTPTTPSLTPGASAATDDEDTDFQSAYSTSPRGSYGSFEHYGSKGYADGESGEQITPTGLSGAHLDAFGVHQDMALKGRERNFSTSTATAVKTRLTSRASEDTVGGN